MSEKLTIQIDGDTSLVEKKISDMEKKIKRMNETSRIGGASNPVTQEYREKFSANLKKEMSRELDKQKSILDNMAKKYLEVDNTLKNSKLNAQQITQATKERADYAEKALQAEQNIARLQSMQSQGLGGLAGIKRLGSAFLGLGEGGVGGFGALNKSATRMGLGGLAGLAGTATRGLGAGLGLAGAGAVAYGNFQAFRAGLPVAQAGRETAITQGTNQLRARAISGDNFEDIMFAPERAKSINKTMDFFEKADSARSFRAKGKAVLGGAGVLTGAGAGALVGSALGPIGTIAGGLIGGIGAGLGAFGNSEEAYYGLTGNQAALSQMTGKEAIDNYETFKMQDRMDDPRKYYQKKFISENKDRLLQLQRSAGINDEDLYGNLGFLRQGSSEFMFNERAGMQQSIVGAGGSGSGAAQLNTMALQAQRSMGLTNSGQTMGRLSSYLNAQESEQAFVKILSKGVSIGLDDSEFREEQKDYFSQVSAIAANIGGGSELVSSSIAAGIEGDISRRGVGMAGDAFKSLSGILNQRGGVTAAARAGLMAGDDAFSNIKGFDKLSFQNMKLEDMRADNPVMKRFFDMAKKGGFEGSIEDFAKKRREVQRQALIQPYKNTALGKGLQEVFDKGSTGELTDEDVAAGQTYLRMIPGFEDKTDEELKVMLKSYTGSERILEESKKKKSEAIRKKNIIDKAKMPYKKGVPFASSGSFEENLFNGTPLGQGEGFAGPLVKGLTDEEKILTGDLSGAPTGIDKMKQAQATQQSKQFDNMSEMTSSFFDNISKMSDQTLKAQLKMESFNQALEKGPEAVESFINALKGKKTPQKPKSFKQKVQAMSKGHTING